MKKELQYVFVGCNIRRDEMFAQLKKRGMQEPIYIYIRPGEAAMSWEKNGHGIGRADDP